MYLNNVLHQSFPNGHEQSNVAEDMGRKAFHWSLQQSVISPSSKRFALEIPANVKPESSNFSKTQSLEFFNSQAPQAPVYRCYSLPMGRNCGGGNYATSSGNTESVRRKVPRNEHNTSSPCGEHIGATARTTKGCEVGVTSGPHPPWLNEARKVLRAVDSNAIKPAFCPNIIHACFSTPGFIQPGNFNFRRLNGTTMVNEGRQMASLRWHISNSLKRHGVCVINRFMGLQAGEFVSREVKSLHSDRICGSGRAMGKNSAGKPVREDLVTWLDGTEPQYPTVAALCAKLDSVVGRGPGVTENYSICGSTKAMVARYKGNGAGYQLHVDNPTKDGRCLTCIYYVNKGWDSKKKGGSLKLYAKTSGKTAEIPPIFDRVVFFYSDSRNPHEVLPTYDDRYAITVWYFDLTQRAKAIERLQAARIRS